MSEENISPQDSVSNLHGVGESVRSLLKNLEVETIEDLLTLLPNRLEDRRNLVPIKDLQFGVESVVDVEIVKTSTRRSKTGRLIIEAKVRDWSGEMPIVWFNQRFILKTLQVGRRILVFGERKPAKSMGHPFFAKKIVDKAKLVPVYPATAGLSQWRISKLITESEEYLHQLTDFLPEKTRNNLGLPHKSEALEKCHLDPDCNSLLIAHKVLAAEELLKLSLKILDAKKTQAKYTGYTINPNYEFIKKTVGQLGFELTDSQRKAAWEIFQDLSKGSPMNRLLYGEVGSGKTAVAELAIAAVLEQGYQAALLAPTVALADQHYQNLAKFFENLGYKVAKLTRSEKNLPEKIDLFIGTHAILNEEERFHNLGLIIIDEQHRFGVAQRQKLLDQKIRPHLLMMTATPIPRSLAQTLFGHLRITYMAGKPKHQKKIETRIFDDRSRNDAEGEISRRLSRGEPGYVICPLILEQSRKDGSLLASQRKTVEAESKRLKQIFPEQKIGVLHGRMKNADKEKIVGDFRAGKIDILLSTTVVEVGIDNPAATWILIEESDRFGLAQLHQLRGRVGRGEKESVCFLSNSNTTPKGAERLQALLDTDEGLKLAEADLKLRGPGELLGLEQSGLPSLKYFDWSDPEFFGQVFAEAEKIVDDGAESYPTIKSYLDEESQNLAGEQA